MSAAVLRPNCRMAGCGSHVGRRRSGPHVFVDLVVPAPGEVTALVVRRQHANGRRDAMLRTWVGGQWSPLSPLPAVPAQPLASVVGQARAFVAGEGVQGGR